MLDTEHLHKDFEGEQGNNNAILSSLLTLICMKWAIENPYMGFIDLQSIPNDYIFQHLNPYFISIKTQHVNNEIDLSEIAFEKEVLLKKYKSCREKSTADNEESDNLDNIPTIKMNHFLSYKQQLNH